MSNGRRPPTIPQADDGGRLERLRQRNADRMSEWHEQHHVDPTHSCTFKNSCRLCEEEGRR